MATRATTRKAAAAAPAADPVPAKASTPEAETQEEEIEGDDAEEQENGDTEEQEEQVASVYDEILDLCRTKEAGGPDFKSQQPKETAQAYLERIIRTISDMKDDEEGTLFGTLPETAQAWYNDACDEMTEKKPISLPDGFVDQLPPAGRKAAAKKGAANGADKADPAPRKAAAKQAAEPRGPGIVTRIQRIILANLDKDRAATRKLIDAQEKDLKDATFSVVYSDTLRTVACLRDLGMLAK